MAHAVAPTTTRVADAAALTSLHSVCGCLRFLWWMSRTGPRTRWAAPSAWRRASYGDAVLRRGAGGGGEERPHEASHRLFFAAAVSTPTLDCKRLRGRGNVPQFGPQKCELIKTRFVSIRERLAAARVLQAKQENVRRRTAKASSAAKIGF